MRDHAHVGSPVRHRQDERARACIGGNGNAPSFSAKCGSRHRSARLPVGAAVGCHGAASGLRLRQRARRRSGGSAALRAPGRCAKRAGRYHLGRAGAGSRPASAHRSGIGYADGRRWPGRRSGGRGSGAGRLGAGAGEACARRIASVCTGAFLLAASGVPDGRRAATHWSFCAELAGRFPAVCSSPIRSLCAMARFGPRPG